MIDSIDFDHVAVAVEHHSQVWPRYGGELGAEWKSSGAGFGFAPAQVGFANGMRLEVLEPHAVERNDFLRRFLDRSGPGPHHLTFKVGDFDAALSAAQDAGYRPVGVDRSDAQWMEMFLHPRDIPGVVVQLAKAAGGGWVTPPPPDWPYHEGEPPRRASLDYVAHAVADLDEGRRLFIELLRGTQVDEGHDAVMVADWIEIGWAGPGRLRLMTTREPDGPLAAWLGGRAGRVHHLGFSRPSAGEVSRAIPLGDGRFEVAPQDNFGMRLILRDSATV